VSSIIQRALHGSEGKLQEQACYDGGSLLQSSNALHILSYVRCVTAAEQFGTNLIAQGPRKGVTLVGLPRFVELCISGALIRVWLMP